MHKTMPCNPLTWLTAQFLNMAKELPNTDASPDVFQMLNENQDCRFESDILRPEVPPAWPRSAVRPGVPQLRKSLSQPQLSLTALASAIPAVSEKPMGGLLLPAAILASTSYQVPSQLPSTKDDSHENSLKNRYHTEPSYDNSDVLKSFQQELKLFSHHSSIKRKAISAPNSPRRASMPDLGESILGGLKALTEPESRKLSLVKEEPEKEMKTENETLALVAAHSSEAKESKPQSNPSSLMTSVPKNPVGGELLKESSTSFTKKMLNWFVTPQKPQSKTDRTEFNAITPTSF